MGRYLKSPTVLLRADYSPELFDGLLAECESYGWRLVNLMQTKDYLPPDLHLVGAVIETPPPAGSALDALRNNGVPIVSISTRHPTDDDRDYRVIEDRATAGAIAADVFSERGFINLAYPTTNDDSMSDHLLKTFVERAKDMHELSVQVVRMVDFDGEGNSIQRYGKQIASLAKWLKELPKPVGILAFNPYMGTRIITACEIAGLQVPEQVAVICRGNVHGQCETALVQLSAIDMNNAERGRRSIRLLKQLSEGETVSRNPILIPVKGVVSRRSTDILAVPDPMVATAMRFMWDYLDQPLTVDDVAFEVNMSRSTLERAFRRSLGRGVNAELRRRRLEHSKALLRGTRQPVAEVAKAVGLADRRCLQRAFKKAFGVTPQEYRKNHASSRE